MRCIRCGCDTYTTETRERNDTYVRRRRKCASCGFLFTTYEFTDDVVNEVEGLLGGRKNAVMKIRQKLPHFFGNKVTSTGYETLKPGDPVFVLGEVRPYKVKCRDQRYIICTKPYNPKHTVMYFIIDLERGVRGPDNMVFCSGYETQEQCEERLKELQCGQIEVSHRHCVSI